MSNGTNEFDADAAADGLRRKSAKQNASGDDVEKALEAWLFSSLNSDEGQIGMATMLSSMHVLQDLPEGAQHAAEINSLGLQWLEACTRANEAGTISMIQKYLLPGGSGVSQTG